MTVDSMDSRLPATTDSNCDPPAAIELRHVSQVFDTSSGPFLAVHDVSFAAREGEFLSVVGPSGCGKSSLLWIIAGIAKPRSGEVLVLGQPVSGVNRDVGIIIQRDALLPWKTALENVTMPLRFRGMKRRAAAKQAQDWLRRVGLEKFAGSYPHQLSGGMRKRVATAATLCYEPKVLLLDEPFSALDVQTRNLMENDLLEIWTGSGQTVLFITHDLEEAVGLSDRVIVMTASPGTVLSEHSIQLSRPRDLLEDKLKADFSDAYGRLWGDLRAEVMRAYHEDTNGGAGTDTGTETKEK
jgi:NitT/TauT family transport system ATP-binding protein